MPIHEPTRGRTRRAQRGVVALLACGALAAALATPASAETTPPALTGVSISPSTINTSGGARTVTISVAATDAGSGVHVVRAGLAGPTGVQFDTSFFGTPTSGTPNDGVWDLQVTLPRFSPQGTYLLTIEVVDIDGNTLTLTPADLAALGVPNLIVQEGVGDSAAPQLDGLQLTPPGVDTSTSDQQVDLTVAALDDLSGTDVINAVLSGPGGAEITSGTQGAPDTGTPTDGVWSLPITVPQGSPTGTYTLSLELTDAVGHATTLSSGALALAGFPSSVVNNDLTPPTLSIDGGPNGPTNVATPIFSFSAEAGSAVQCSLDQGTPAFGPCSGGSSHTSPTPLADGNWTFRVKATDLAANVANATRSFTVDTVAPATQIDSGPSGLITTMAADFAFSSDPGASFECRLDGSGGFAACSSPQPYAGLADGNHSFEVRAIDAAGNADQSPASRAFSVDAAPPALSISSGPEGTTSDQQPSFTFNAEAGSAVQCSLDQGTPVFGPCATGSSHSPAAPLADGDWTFRVRATDAGNHTSTATRSFTVDTTQPDTTAPNTLIASGPKKKSTKPKATFTFSADGATRFECNFDNAGWKACSSPAKYKKLNKGKHSFAVRGIDAAGNADQSPAAMKFKVAPKK